MKREMRFVFLALVFAIFAVGLVSAVDTQITILTYVGHTASVNILDPSSGEALQTFQTNATDTGTIVVTYSSGTRTIDVMVIIRNNLGKIVRNQKFTGYTTGSPLSFDMKPDPNAPKPAPVVPVVPVVNITPVVNATPVVPVVNNSAKNSSLFWKIPSINISNLWKDYGKYVYYFVYALLAVVVIFLLIKFMPKIISRMPKMPSGPVVGKSTAEGYRYNTKTEKQLADAERKIREAQAEIDRIRNKKKMVSEAERKFEEAKRELERLKDY